MNSFDFPEFYTIELSTKDIYKETKLKEIPVGDKEENYIYFFKVVGESRP